MKISMNKFSFVLYMWSKSNYYGTTAKKKVERSWSYQSYIICTGCSQSLGT